MSIGFNTFWLTTMVLKQHFFVIILSQWQHTQKKKLHIAGVAHVFSAENWGPEPEKFWTPRLMICIWNVQREEQLNQYLKKQSSWQPRKKPKVVVLPTVFVSKVTSLERYNTHRSGWEDTQHVNERSLGHWVNVNMHAAYGMVSPKVCYLSFRRL